MKQNWKNIIGAAFVIIIIPILIYCFFAKKATIGEWLGFFGSYIGSAISIAFAYINTMIQMKKANEKEVIGDLHNLLLSTETILSYLEDLDETLANVSNNKQSSNLFGIDIDIQKIYQIISQKFFNVTTQVNNFKVDFGTIMDRLEKSEIEKLESYFKKWFDWYRIVYSGKFLINIYSIAANRDGSDRNGLEGNIPKLIKATKELSSSIKDVYNKRMETNID